MFASTVYWARNCSHNPSELTTYTKINENEKPTIDISTQFFPVIQFPLSYNFIVHMFQNDSNILYWFIYFGMVVAFRSLCSIHLYLEDGSTKKNTYYYTLFIVNLCTESQGCLLEQSPFRLRGSSLDTHKTRRSKAKKSRKKRSIYI